MKRSFSKVSHLVVVLLITLFIGLITPAQYASAAVVPYSRSQAVNWVKARADESWCEDVDGSYGCQCVDLILAYYDYLLGYHQSGNAIDYASNPLPEDWKKVSGSPQPGDVVVWGPGVHMDEGGTVLQGYPASIFG